MDAEFETEGDHLSDGIDAFAMACDSRKTAEFSPSAVTVHDDCDMFREQFRLQLGG
jgi:hypothetical protein